LKARVLGILSMITASLCCVGPLVLILLGLGGLGVGAYLGKYHGYFILAAAIFLGFAWHRYLKEKRVCDSKQCEMTGRSVTKFSLIFATVVVLTFAGLNLSTHARESPKESAIQQGTREFIPIEGMSCLSCEMTIQSAVGKLPGVHRVQASAKEQSATVDYDPQMISIDQIMTVINETGFKAGEPAQ
jgi:mercuric ion transport protein